MGIKSERINRQNVTDNPDTKIFLPLTLWWGQIDGNDQRESSITFQELSLPVTLLCTECLWIKSKR